MNSLLAMYGDLPYRRTNESKPVESKREEGFVIDFKTEKGKIYTIIPL